MSVTPEVFRKVMGRFATGVTVVTLRDRQGPHGMTANAVTSVSLDPMLLLVCVAHQAITHDRLLAAGHFAVNILGAGSRHLSQHFAGRHHQLEDPFAGIPYRPGRTGAPILEAAIAYLECRVHATYPGGDHTIVVGEVLGAAECSDEAPLIFYGSRYRALAPEEAG